MGINGSIIITDGHEENPEGTPSRCEYWIMVTVVVSTDGVWTPRAVSYWGWDGSEPAPVAASHAHNPARTEHPHHDQIPYATSMSADGTRGNTMTTRCRQAHPMHTPNMHNT